MSKGRCLDGRGGHVAEGLGRDVLLCLMLWGGGNKLGMWMVTVYFSEGVMGRDFWSKVEAD